MFDAVCRLPVLLERIDTDFSGVRDIWMEDFGREPTCKLERQSTHQSRYQTSDVHFGGAAGNSSVNLNFTLKYPPAYGVPSAMHKIKVSQPPC